ncbi:hypothetical protein JMUB3935_1034 [Leptotrichia trevisanii]|uniref:Cation diffusion facilitator family transporter n=1 Tax=Leptotrichia trevisanii TaxID=109328 RepID=A0A510KK66_9FUSO|nr:cation diffusion facilitator family transporter [Leptotrichia trevisanii]BBM52056.1 hypothetical protein JMUB3935_1034 [Leptotrichia trevisanii]
MGSKEFAFALNSEENFEGSFDFDELGEKLQSQLKLELSELEILKENQKQIGDPDNLGKVVEDVIWEQVNNQIAIVAGEDFIKENGGMTLDLRNEAHIQTTENFINGKIATHNTKINFQERYDDWQSNFQKNEDGSIKVDKSGKKVLTNKARDYYDEGREKGTASIHKDHTKSVAEILRDPDAATHLTKEDKKSFANGDKNLKDLDASANMSKGDKSMDEWLNSERDGKKPAERFNINEEELKERGKAADEAFEDLKTKGKKKSIETGKQSQKEEAFRMGGKALRAVVMQLLASFVKEVIAKLIKWFKTTKGKFEMLWDSLKEAIHSFIGKMKTHLINAGNVLFTTIATAIVGPVFRTLKQVWMLLKQGWQAIKNAIDYIKSPENKNKPIGLLILETGKIVIAGLTAAGAIALSEAIEKGLSSIPILMVEIPLLGSLANIIGIFMGAVVSGIIGAIAINLIQKMIKNKYETQIVDEKIDKSNEILRIQHKIINLNEDRVVETKERVVTNIKERHKNASDYIKDTFNKVFGEKNSTQEKMDEIDSLLEELMR